MENPMDLAELNRLRDKVKDHMALTRQLSVGDLADLIELLTFLINVATFRPEELPRPSTPVKREHAKWCEVQSASDWAECNCHLKGT